MGTDLAARAARTAPLLPVGCGLARGEQELERSYEARTFARDVRWTRAVAAKCRAANGTVLRHLTTRDTARDLDVVRAVLGERKISYLGFSYGTYLGAGYARMFPRRADRFVLDIAVGPARYGRGMFRAMAEGAEPAFARRSAWTARRHAAYGLGVVVRGDGGAGEIGEVGRVGGRRAPGPSCAPTPGRRGRAIASGTAATRSATSTGIRCPATSRPASSRVPSGSGAVSPRPRWTTTPGP